MYTTVQCDERGLFVEDEEGTKYTGDCLPECGTCVELDSYTGIDDNPHANAEWDADTPCGRSWAELEVRW